MRPAHEQICKSSKAFFQRRWTSVRRGCAPAGDEADQQQSKSAIVAVTKKMVHAGGTLQYDKHAWHDSSYKGI
ncbi:MULTISPECIES: hypothetical protein [unclassified Herbaspirillum]|jgi:hypothetical protein|uniref:hypothetical protein n=1 Tax=unclassified Herbaspirillum TaxID=2624150 RepID=UPI0012F696FC|nr:MULTISPECIES: hypothetical protein [unclassified Herbaspirillum]MCI1004304.1 hypothetical protein [Herbaspirillum sp. C7C8]